jgi:hypothetical protein
MAKAAEPLHDCNWKGCKKRVPRSMWGCIDHWSKLPRILRDKITRTWNRGRGFGTTNYQAACHEAQAWIATHGDKT